MDQRQREVLRKMFWDRIAIVIPSIVCAAHVAAGVGWIASGKTVLGVVWTVIGLSWNVCLWIAARTLVWTSRTALYEELAERRDHG